MKKKTDGKTELGSMIKLARGDRSLRQYAKDAGVSYTTVYVIENGEYTPTPKMIQKLTSKQANPQNGITYEDVMNAAGYKTEQDEEKGGGQGVKRPLDTYLGVAHIEVGDTYPRLVV